MRGDRFFHLFFSSEKSTKRCAMKKYIYPENFVKKSSRFAKLSQILHILLKECGTFLLTSSYIYISAKLNFREIPFLSEIENPRSAPFSTKIGVWIDNTHKNFRKICGKCRNFWNIFLRASKNHCILYIIGWITALLIEQFFSLMKTFRPKP